MGIIPIYQLMEGIAMAISVLNRFSQDLAIDLGTVNTLIARKGWGILLREKSVVAVSNAVKNEVVAIGSSAPEVSGRVPGGISLVQPLRDGVISDISLACVMLSGFIKKALGKRPRLFGINVVVCVPGCITQVEQAAIEEAAHSAGARSVTVVEESLAAAVGADLPVYGPTASMVVDIGGGTTDAAVISLGGIAASNSVRTGGTHINEAIIAYLRQKTGITIGDKTAEQVKLSVGLEPSDPDMIMRIKGRRMDTGLPDAVHISACELAGAMEEPASRIVEAVVDTLAGTPPEMAGDIIDTGIVLTGGGALLKGLCARIENATGLPVMVAESSMDCVITGALRLLERRGTFSEPMYASGSANAKLGNSGEFARQPDANVQHNMR